VLSVDWSPDGTKLAIGAIPSVTIGVVLVIDPNTDQVLLSLRAEDGPGDVAWSPDGSLLAAAGSNLFGTFGEDALIIWDSTSGVEIRRITGELMEGINPIAWSPDATRIATGGNIDHTVRIWSVTTGSLVGTLQGHTDSVIKWSPDGNHLATGGQDNTARIWDVASGRLLTTFDLGHFAEDLAWSPDGTKLATLSYGTGQVWDVATGEMLSSFIGRGGIAWSPDGNRIASGQRGNTVAIHTVSDAPILTPLPLAIPTHTPTS
jgi:WD40 repeat protein